MRSVAFCASQRFKTELSQFTDELRRLAAKRRINLIIFEPNFNGDSYNEKGLHLLPEKERLLDPTYKAEIAGKVYDHLFRKVKVADVCFVFNKYGYLGANTNGELFAAAMSGKLIYSLEEKTMMGNFPEDLYEEPSSKKLIHEVVGSPKDLLLRLL